MLEGGLLVGSGTSLTERRNLALSDSIALVVQISVRISRSNRRKGTNSAPGAFPELDDGRVLRFPGAAERGCRTSGPRRLAEGEPLRGVGTSHWLGYQPVAVLVQEGVRLHGPLSSGKGEEIEVVFEYELIIRVRRI